MTATATPSAGLPVFPTSFLWEPSTIRHSGHFSRASPKVLARPNIRRISVKHVIRLQIQRQQILFVPSFSNVSAFLDLLAPSDRVYASDISGVNGYAHGDYCGAFGGTSASCPYAAGGAACLQNAAQSVRGSHLTPSEVRSHLASTGDLIIDQKVSMSKPRINLGSAIEAINAVSLCQCGDLHWVHLGPFSGLAKWSSDKIRS